MVFLASSTSAGTAVDHTTSVDTTARVWSTLAVIALEIDKFNWSYTNWFDSSNQAIPVCQYCYKLIVDNLPFWSPTAAQQSLVICFSIQPPLPVQTCIPPAETVVAVARRAKAMIDLNIFDCGCLVWRRSTKTSRYLYSGDSVVPVN